MQFVKDPDATVDFAVDWSEWLAGDTITTSVWLVPEGLVPAGLVEEASPAASVVGDVATVWLSGGVAGTSYTVTNRVTTAAGRVDDRSFPVAVQHR